MQVKLLRALQEGEVEPVGATKPEKVDIRIVSATNKRLLNLTKEGHFREDLFYRLNVFPIYLPPLRERHGDLEPLIEHFITLFLGRRRSSRFRAVIQMHWPCSINMTGRAMYVSLKTPCIAQSFWQTKQSCSHKIFHKFKHR